MSQHGQHRQCNAVCPDAKRRRPVHWHYLPSSCELSRSSEAVKQIQGSVWTRARKIYWVSALGGLAAGRDETNRGSYGKRKTDH